MSVVENMSIKDNIKLVRKRIERAALNSGRQASEITLVVVTKNRPIEQVKQVINAGICDVGENRAQEIVPKYQAIGSSVNWHFIGYLQRNKVKYVIPFVYLIQSVDSIALAYEIDKRAKMIGKIQNILLEVNTSGEISKYGLKPEEVDRAIDEIKKLKNVFVKGLMTIGPNTDDKELIRKNFAKLKNLFDNLSSKQGQNVEMKHLSMGMTNDFEIAIEEGSTMVRIGTAIFETLGGEIYA